jgi:hypothetical protein
MDKQLKYQEIIVNLLETWKGYTISNLPNLTIDIHINKENSNFIVLSYGWHEDEYIYNVLFHIQIKDDTKVWLHEDTTGIGIAKELMEAGIQKEDLIIGFAEVLEDDLVTTV